MAAGARELLLFANPTSGNGRSLRAAQSAERALRAAGRVPLLVGDRAELSRRLRAQAGPPDEVWVCGGDGTLRELASRLPPGVRPLVGLIPTGTGNVVARTFGIPLRVDAAIEVALRAPERRLDLGRIDLSFTAADRDVAPAFTFMASAGLDAEIAAEVARRRRGPMRRSDWLEAALAAPRYAREAPLRVVADGRDLGLARYAALFNCGLYAGSFRVCPTAAPDDGRLELLLLREPIRPRFVRVAFAAWRGRLASLPDAELHRVTSATLSDVAALQVDGDPEPGGTREFTLDPSPLRLRAPPP